MPADVEGHDGDVDLTSLKAGALASSAPRRRKALGLVALIGLCTFLAWLVITTSFAAFYAEFDPETALILNPKNSTALLNLAERSLNEVLKARLEAAQSTNNGASANGRFEAFSELAKKAQQDPAKTKPTDAPVAVAPIPPPVLTDAQRVKLWSARGFADRALSSKPLNARALRILGQIADEMGDRVLAAKFMQVATRQSLHEPIASYWMLGWSVEHKDLDAALSYADALLRTQSAMPAFVVPFLGVVAATEGGMVRLKALLATNPPWRSVFFSVLPNAVRDLHIPLELLLSLKGSQHPPTTPELRAYLDPLISGKQYELAYYTWLQFLPEEQLGSVGLLFNGSFDIPLSSLPFDWQLPSGSGVTTEIARRSDQNGRNVLRISFGEGRGNFAGISELIMLAAGTYRLEGSYRGDLVGRRGLVWRITCAEGGNQPIGLSQMFIGPKPTWTDFEFSFSVPVSGCRAQRLQLFLDARSESEKLISGTAWFDNLKITRLVEHLKPL